MRKIAAATLLLCLTGCSAAPSVNVPERPAVTTFRPALSEVQLVRSAGGITAWLVSEPAAPVIAMEVAWAAGEAVEPADIRGAGRVLSSIIGEGAGEWSSPAYGARMQDLNMRFSCESSLDWTSCGMTTLKDTSADSFGMLRQAFSAPRFDDEPIERAKRGLIAELRRQETDPGVLASRAMSTYLLPGHPYSREITGETVNQIAKSDLKQLMKQIFTRDKLLVVVVGDITAEELKLQLDHIFGALPAASDLPVVPDATAQPAAKNIILRRLPLPQTLLTFSGPGVGPDSADYYAAHTLNCILGGCGPLSRLADENNSERDVFSRVETALAVQQHFSRWTGSGVTTHDRAEESVRRIRETIDALGREGPTPEEFNDARNFLTGSFPLGFDSTVSIAKSLMLLRKEGRDVDYLKKRNTFFDALTLEDVRRVASRYMKSENFSFVLIGSPEG